MLKEGDNCEVHEDQRTFTAAAEPGAGSDALGNSALHLSVIFKQWDDRAIRRTWNTIDASRHGQTPVLLAVNGASGLGIVILAAGRILPFGTHG